jgi:UDP-N-acetylmuramoylalanine--D-glutamate ligase
MSDTRNKPTAAVIVGLGVTGLSCARYLLGRGWRVCVTDSRVDPPGRAELAMLDPGITVRFGHLDTSLLDEAVCVVASPGVSLSDPFFAEARRRGITIAGDIELFAVAADAPVVGITGTNGKSTVTTLLGRMAERAGMRVRVFPGSARGDGPECNAGPYGPLCVAGGIRRREGPHLCPLRHGGDQSG